MIETTKDISFSGLRVGAFESRMQAEMTRLIENLNGQPFVAPSVREVPLDEHREAFAFWEELKNGRIDMVILMTGVGTRTLIKALSTKVPTVDLIAALEKTVIVVRGPKPVKVLTEFGLAPHIRVPEPNTWRDVLKTLDAKRDVKGLRVAVQEYGEPNRIFLAELQERGAKVMSVSVYRAMMPEDTQPLRQMIHKVVANEIDVLLFTNATQVEHMMAIAREEGKAQEFRKALQRVCIVSVGPSCTDMLRGHGLPVDLTPERPMMGALVAKAAEGAAVVLADKRSAKISVQNTSAGVAKPGDALHQSRFLKACRREQVDRTPIWLMRQAGRYMKEYRELRAKVSFLELCHNSDLCAEVTVDAAHRLGVDAAIIFSDLLLLVQPLGFDLSYGKDAGPQIANPFKIAEDLKRVKPVDVDDSMEYVYQAIRKTRHALKPDIPLIGFAGAPFTMASYIIEGKGSKNFVDTKSLMYNETKAWHGLLEKITDATIAYLNGQVAAGAQAVQIFDSWVGCLSPEDFRKYVLPHSRRLAKSIVPGVPVITFGTQTTGLLPLFKEAGGDVIGVDWRIELDEAWDILGDMAIMGNLDPVVLFSNPAEVRAHAKRILTQANNRPGHIFNLGHGILPGTPIENVFALIEAVKEFSAPVKISYELLHKYNVQGPRYTSYPPAPSWSANIGANDYEEAIAGGNKAAAPVSLYFHLPFCEQLCYFCGCTTVITGRDRRKEDPYLDTILKEVDWLGQRVDRKRGVVQLHLGGGTPTYYTPEKLDRLFERIRANFTLAPDAEMGVEVDPRVTSVAHLESLRKNGFNRLSMGVQDFDPTVQKAINRHQPFEATRDLIVAARQLGFQSINMDLIYGLPHQTEATFEATIEKVLQIGPDRMAIYSYAHVPWMKKHQEVIAKYLPDEKQKFAIFLLAMKRFSESGFEYIGMDHFAKPGDELSRARKDRTLWRNFQGYTTKAGTDLFGLGMSAIGNVNGGYYQNQRELVAYQNAINSTGIATVRGFKLSKDDAIRARVIQNLLCHAVVIKSEIEKQFGITFDTYFSEALSKLKSLEADGLVHLTPTEIQPTETGRVFLRNLAMPFDAYLPKEGETKVFSRTV